MAIVSAKPDLHSSDRRSRWVIALAMTSLVAVAAFALALHQFVLKFLYDQSSYTRTLGGLLFILLGAAGICLPVILLRNRQRFLSLRPSRQWLLAVSIPLVHVLVLAACLAAAQRSRTILLPRPFITTAIVHYRLGDSRVEFRGRWRRGVGLGGYNDAEVLADGNEKFSSYLHESFIRDSPLEGPQTVAIVGRAKRENDGSVRIVLEVDARETLRFVVENLDDVKVTRDGQVIENSVLPPGTYQVAIVGAVKKGA